MAAERLCHCFARSQKTWVARQAAGPSPRGTRQSDSRETHWSKTRHSAALSLNAREIAIQLADVLKPRYVGVHCVINA